MTTTEQAPVSDEELAEREETAASPTTEADTEPVLAPKISTRWAATPTHVAITLLFGLLFLLLNFLPLRPTDLWGHVNYGHWIIEHRNLPTEDPYLPLAEGVQVVDTMWLSQIILGTVDQHGGPDWLSHGFAIIGLLTYLIIARTIYLQTRRPLVVLLGTMAALLVGWSRLTTIRPENFGLLCFVTLLWLIVGSRASTPYSTFTARKRTATWSLWIGVPLIMMLWANMHGSFVCGLAVLGCFFLGAVVEVGWKTKSFRQVLNDKTVRRWLYLTELGFVATLINPYGIDLFLFTTLFSSNENLKDILEWQPLVLLGVGGREFALSLIILLFALRFSRRPVPVAHVLLLALFGIASAFGIRMLTWYAPVFAIVLAPHLADILSQLRPAPRPVPLPAPESDEEMRRFQMPKGRSFIYTCVCVFIVWVSFAFAPISQPILGGVQRTPEQLYGEMTPTNLVSYLKENPTEGQVFNPQYWGDWLVRETGPEFEPFVTTNIHLVPEQVWQDYMGIYGAQRNYGRALKRYRVETLILDKSQQEDLRRSLRRSETWEKRYEDDQAILYTRRDLEEETRDEEDE